MTREATTLVAGKFLGWGPVPREISSRQDSGHHYFCPKCGTVWAQIIPVEPPPYHAVHSIPCPLHGTGSLRLWGNFPLDFLPYDALVREIEIILKHGDRYEFNWH